MRTARVREGSHHSVAIYRKRVQPEQRRERKRKRILMLKNLFLTVFLQKNLWQILSLRLQIETWYEKCWRTWSKKWWTKSFSKAKMNTKRANLEIQATILACSTSTARKTRSFLILKIELNPVIKIITITDLRGEITSTRVQITKRYIPSKIHKNETQVENISSRIIFPIHITMPKPRAK